MSTAQELFDEAIEHYKKIIGYLDDVGEICKKYDLDYSASDLIRRFDIILQMTLLQTAVGDNDFDRLERVFIEEITSCGDVLDWINGECDTNFTWENVFYLSE